MSSYQDRIALSTDGHGDMHDPTEPVTRIVGASGIEAGLAHVHNVGSTGAVGSIEFEPGLQRDLPEVLDEIAPPDRGYVHEQRFCDDTGSCLNSKKYF